MKLTTTDTPDAPAKTRRRAQRHPSPSWNNDPWHTILFEGEDPARVADICRVVVDKFRPQNEYDHYLANISAASTYLLERFMEYEQRLTECKVIDQRSLVESQYQSQSLDTSDRAALAFRDSDFIQSMRFLRESGTTSLRRALLINNELRKPATKS